MKLAGLLMEESLPGGLGGLEVSRVSAMEHADSGSLVFATDLETLDAALRSGAGAILASASLREQSGQADRVVYVKDPRFSFALAASRLRVRNVKTEVHASAVIGDGVQMGAGCKVGAGAVLYDGVMLGEACEIGARVTIYAGTQVGDRVIVQAGAVLGSTGFGYARDRETGRYLLFPQQGTLAIGDDVEIGANTTIDRGALGETRIGAGTKIDNLVHVGHNCRIGRDVIIAAQTGISGSSVIEDGAILGGQVGIGEHATVGKGVILGGGAGVLTGKKMEGAGQVFWGRPARPLKEYLRDWQGCGDRVERYFRYDVLTCGRMAGFRLAPDSVLETTTDKSSKSASSGLPAASHGLSERRISFVLCAPFRLTIDAKCVFPRTIQPVQMR